MPEPTPAEMQAQLNKVTELLTQLVAKKSAALGQVRLGATLGPLDAPAGTTAIGDVNQFDDTVYALNDGQLLSAANLLITYQGLCNRTAYLKTQADLVGRMQVVDLGEGPDTYLFNQPFLNQGTYADITNSAYQTAISCLAKDIVEYEWDPINCDNNISLEAASVEVTVVEDLGGADIETSIKVYSVPAQNFQANITQIPLVPLHVRGRFVIANPGVLQLRLRCQGQASDSQVVVRSVCASLIGSVGRYTVYRPIS